MYDYEIMQFLSERNYLLSNKEYVYMCTTSPQLKYIKYNPFEDCFEAWSDHSYFKFKVHPDED